MKYHKLMGVGLIVYGLLVGVLAFKDTDWTAALSFARISDIKLAKVTPSRTPMPPVKITPIPTLTTALASIPQTIKVLTPNGGERLIKNSVYKITWEADRSIKFVKLMLQPEGCFDTINECSIQNLPVGSSVISRKAPNDGYFNWNVGKIKGQDIIPPGRYRVIVRDFDGNQSDASDDFFAIAKKKGEKLKITGPKSDLPRGKVGEQYVVEIIAEGGDDSYGWSVSGGQLPSGLTLSSPVCIKFPCQVNATVNGVPDDMGNYDFKIKVISGAKSDEKEFNLVVRDPAPAVRMKSPDGGEKWKVGSKRNIKWEVRGLPENSRQALFLYKGNQNYFGVSISGELGSDVQSYKWTIPNKVISGKDYQIEVVVFDPITHQPIASDKSDANFSVTGTVVSYVARSFAEASIWDLLFGRNKEKKSPAPTPKPSATLEFIPKITPTITPKVTPVVTLQVTPRVTPILLSPVPTAAYFIQYPKAVSLRELGLALIRLIFK